ncbi:MAG: flagellar basal body L-ring protein FlgH [Verrucomicrobia bacterium]|jgi:flagellar L-ring protein precursor FlgH|nr:flagellar basal body L-ring protein FlgH [Verrucomicrobiota bacterium]
MKTVSRSASSLAIAAVLTAAAPAASLWPNSNSGSQASMYADRKASRQGDILTIVVAESAVASSSQSTKSSRESSLEDAISRFVYSGLGKRRGELPATSASGSAGYSGGGDISNSQSLSARAAVVVTDVLPNGNLVVEGVRVVRFSGETQYVVLHGLVRPDDIGRDNSVISTNIADARVEFHAEGALTDAQKRGWLAKTYEKLRPF